MSRLRIARVTTKVARPASQPPGDHKCDPWLYQDRCLSLKGSKKYVLKYIQPPHEFKPSSLKPSIQPSYIVCQMRVFACSRGLACCLVGNQWGSPDLLKAKCAVMLVSKSNTHRIWMKQWGIVYLLKANTPSYEQTILGSKQPVSGIKFFCRFSLRLSENKRSRVMFIAKFGLTASAAPAALHHLGGIFSNVANFLSIFKRG